MGTLLLSSTRLTLAEDRIRSGWMMLTAPVMRSPYLSARIEVLESMTATTMKMLVLYAQVTHAIIFLPLIRAQLVLDKSDKFFFNYFLLRNSEVD